MKAIILKIDKFSTRDGPGIRTVVCLKGCFLRCRWCHSPESWSFGIQKYPNGEIVGIKMSAEEVMAEVLKDRDFYEASGGGMTLSGGDPLARPAFSLELLRMAKAQGLHTAVETSGYAKPAEIDALLPFVDIWLWDVKKLDAKKHFEYTLRPLEPILENLGRVNSHILKDKESNRHIVLRCPMIPGLNDTNADLMAIARLADSMQAVSGIDIEPYIPYGIQKAHRLGLKVYEAPQPPPEYGRRILARLSPLTSKPVRLP